MGLRAKYVSAEGVKCKAVNSLNFYKSVNTSLWPNIIDHVIAKFSLKI